MSSSEIPEKNETNNVVSHFTETDRFRSGPCAEIVVPSRTVTDSRKVFLIVDRLKAHEAKAVKDWAAEHRGRIELFLLPRYSPERNPEEYLNNDLKGAINSSGLPGSEEELRSRMERFMSQLRHLPGHVRNYFQHPCVQYAAGM